MRNPPWIRIAAASDRITQQRPSPPTGSTSLQREKRTILLNRENFYVRNAINRYGILSSMPLKYNADGSLDVRTITSANARVPRAPHYTT